MRMLSGWPVISVMLYAGHDGKLADQHLGEVFGDLLLDLRQDAILGFQHEDFAAEVAADLRHFHADDAAADDAQAGGRARQVPDGVGGEHAAAGHAFAGAGDRRDEGRGAGGDDGGAEGQGGFRAVLGHDLQVWASTKLAKPWRTSILMPLSAFMASSPRVCSTFLRWASRVAQSRRGLWVPTRPCPGPGPGRA
jgi:hypothetical protein